MVWKKWQSRQGDSGKRVNIVERDIYCRGPGS